MRKLRLGEVKVLTWGPCPTPRLSPASSSNVELLCWHWEDPEVLLSPCPHTYSRSPGVKNLWREEAERGLFCGHRLSSSEGRLLILGRPVLSPRPARRDWSSGSKSGVMDRAQLGTAALTGAGPGPGWETSPPLAPSPEKLSDFFGWS